MSRGQNSSCRSQLTVAHLQSFRRDLSFMHVGAAAAAATAAGVSVVCGADAAAERHATIGTYCLHFFSQTLLHLLNCKHAFPFDVSFPAALCCDGHAVNIIL
jgi:hypothetical protein